MQQPIDPERIRRHMRRITIDEARRAERECRFDSVRITYTNDARMVIEYVQGGRVIDSGECPTGSVITIRDGSVSAPRGDLILTRSVPGNLSAGEPPDWML